MASILIPHANGRGGSRDVVEHAARTIDRTGGPEGYLEQLGSNAAGYTYVARGWWAKRMGGLHGIPPTDRLALEMALHEEVEERALRGELAELERAWRDAEEIASISDGLLSPPPVTENLERLRRT